MLEAGLRVAVPGGVVESAVSLTGGPRRAAPTMPTANSLSVGNASATVPPVRNSARGRGSPSAAATRSRSASTGSAAFQSAPNSSWSLRWRGTSGMFGVVTWCGRSQERASEIVDGIPRR
jgi:hypothetical protein